MLLGIRLHPKKLPTPQPWLYALIYLEKEGHDYPGPVASFQGLRKSNNAYCRLHSNLHRKRPAALGKMCQWQCRVILLLWATLHCLQVSCDVSSTAAFFTSATTLTGTSKEPNRECTLIALKHLSRKEYTAWKSSAEITILREFKSA